MLEQVRNPEALILTDVFGATPCNVAQRLADGVQVQGRRRRQRADVLALPLLQPATRSMPLVARAVAGATQGVMQVATSRPQNQTLKARGSDQATTRISNKLGLHARASAKLTKLAGGFRSEIFLSRNGRRVNAKSIMGVMMLAAGIGTEVEIEAEGEDEQQAMAAIVALIDDKFGEGQ